MWFINARTFVSYSVILLGGPEGYSFARTIPYDLATVDGTGGPLFDVNGDGRSDRLVFPNGVPAALYFGSPTGFTFAAALPRCTRTSRVCGPYWHFSAETSTATASAISTSGATTLTGSRSLRAVRRASAPSRSSPRTPRRSAPSSRRHLRHPSCEPRAASACVRRAWRGTRVTRATDAPPSERRPASSRAPPRCAGGGRSPLPSPASVRSIRRGRGRSRSGAPSGSARGLGRFLRGAAR